MKKEPAGPQTETSGVGAPRQIWQPSRNVVFAQQEINELERFRERTVRQISETHMDIQGLEQEKIKLAKNHGPGLNGMFDNLIARKRKDLEQLEGELVYLQNRTDELRYHTLSDWEKDITPELRGKLRDPNYLPTLAEVDSIRPYLFDYSEEFGDHEILNQEFIEALALHLTDSIVKFIKRSRQTPTIVESGAGTGRLTHLLSKAVDRRLPKNTPRPTWIPIDTFEAGLPINFEVTKMSLQDSLAQHKPDIIIASWPVVDVGKAVTEANQTGVKEILLMGEPEICAGGSHDVWQDIPGFEQNVLTEATRAERGRTDGHRYMHNPFNYHKSVTTSFMRQNE